MKLGNRTDVDWQDMSPSRGQSSRQPTGVKSLRIPLTIAAIAVLVLAIAFVVWASAASQPVADEGKRQMFAEELHGLQGKLVPKEMQERALKMGADPVEARKELAKYHLDPDAPQIWGQAVFKPIRAVDERSATYGPWRIPVLAGGFGVALLLLALANKRQ